VESVIYGLRRRLALVQWVHLPREHAIDSKLAQATLRLVIVIVLVLREPVIPVLKHRLAERPAQRRSLELHPKLW